MNKIKIVFMGTPDFACPVLQSLIDNNYNVELVISQPDKLVGRKHILTNTPVKQIAINNNIEVFQPNKIKDDYKKVMDIKPDIIITCAYGQIIPEELINLPRLGCINVHASLLPKYRGGAPIHWAKINGERKTGITIMYMDKNMDTGDIIIQEELDILDTDSTESLFNKLSLLGSKLLIKTLPSIIDGTNSRIKQDERLASYAYNIKRDDERIDFNNKGNSIINKVKGLYSWPLANFKIDNIEYKVLDAYFSKEEADKPGVIKIITKNSFGITCNDGIIYITKIKPFGKKEMEIKDFLNGIDKDKFINKEVN
jgi:methionyl-tRNA formyltransferase